MIQSVLVAEEHPWPPGGGVALRNAANVAGLAAAGAVTVVGVGDRAGPRPPSPLGEHQAVGLGHPPESDPLNRWAAGPSGHPSDSRWSRAAGDRLRAVLGDVRPDVVVFEQLWLHRYIGLAHEAGAATVLDAHNVESDVYSAIAVAERSGHHDERKRLAALMARRTAALEASVTASVDQVWACSDRDRDWFAGAGADARVVPNVVDVRRPPRRTQDRCQCLLVYPASFAYPPNVRAARTLLDHVLPAFVARVPGARLALVGHSPPQWLRDRARHRDDVIVTGAVPSIRPWLDRALAVVVPLQEGGGTRFKVLEAMAAGVPVISTPKGIEGLALTPGGDVLVGDGAAELAEHVHRVWLDPVLAAALATRARATVEECYSQQAATNAIRVALQSVVEPRSRAGMGTA